MEETEPGVRSSQQIGQVSEEGMQSWKNTISVHLWVWTRLNITFVILRESICVHNVETSHREKLFALDEVLPFSFQDLNAWFLVPTELLHVL